MEKWQASNKRVVAWGAGSKGVTFLNILETKDQIPYIVDINPRKKGMFVAGSGQEIIDPDSLADFKPDIVILMNPIYKDEISVKMVGMGLISELLVA